MILWMHRDAPRCTATHRDAPRRTAILVYTLMLASEFLFIHDGYDREHQNLVFKQESVANYNKNQQETSIELILSRTNSYPGKAAYQHLLVAIGFSGLTTLYDGTEEAGVTRQHLASRDSDGQLSALTLHHSNGSHESPFGSASIYFFSSFITVCSVETVVGAGSYNPMSNRLSEADTDLFEII